VKITANAGELAVALALAATLGEDKRVRNLRSLEAVNLVTDGATVKIRGNVLDHAVSLAVPADIEEPGALAVSGQRLAALAAGFPKDAKIQVGDDGAAARVICGRSRFQLPVIPQDELPAAPAIDEEIGRALVEREEALALFERPLFAAGTEPTRSYLCGIFLHNVDGALVAVGTDGHRLVRIAVPGGAGLSRDDHLIVPRPAVKIILKLLADRSHEFIGLRRSATLLVVEAAAFNFTSKLIDATYPDYKRAIPKPSNQAVTVERAALAQALERVKAVADPTVRARPLCGLAWQDNELRLCLAGHSDAADDVIDAMVDGAGRTAAQIHHLVELLEGINSKRVRIDAADALAPVLITDPDDPDFLAVQMPCRVPFQTSQAA
jgi:DNA polymerase-3 subunit beta